MKNAMIRSKIGKTLYQQRNMKYRKQNNKKEFACFIDIYYFKRIMLKEFQ